MTAEQQNMLELEMEDALKITDRERREEAVQTVTLHYLKALCICQRKTADREATHRRARSRQAPPRRGATPLQGVEIHRRRRWWCGYPQNPFRRVTGTRRHDLTQIKKRKGRLLFLSIHVPPRNFFNHSSK